MTQRRTIGHTTPWRGQDARAALVKRSHAPRFKEIFERDIRAQVEADHDGEIVAIDVDSGEWAIGEERDRRD